MKRLICFIITFLMCFCQSVQYIDTVFAANENYVETTIYCSPDGDDNAAGTIDMPIKTLKEARNRVRGIAANAAGPIKVYFRGGEYKFNSTVSFTEMDSGSKNSTVEYSAYKNEEPVFSGSTDIPFENLKPLGAAEKSKVSTEAANYIYKVDLKALGVHCITKYVGFSGDEYIEQVKNATIPLIFNDKEQLLAQWPNGTAHYKTITDFKSYSDFMIDSEKRMINWVNAEDAVIAGWMRYGYSYQRVPVKKFYPDEQRVVTEYDVPRGVTTGGSWKITNLLEELDTPGEYYVDTKNLKLYFFPPYLDGNPKLEISTNESTMISLSNASNLCFKGITFKNTRADAIEMRKTNNISVLGCKFRNVALMGIDSMHCKNTTVDGCDFVNIGSTGVRMDERVGDSIFESTDIMSVRLDLTHQNNIVNNCYFWDVATQPIGYTGAVRLHGVGNTLSNSSMHESSSGFIHYGGNDLKILNNELWNGLKLTRDMGMIYNGRNVVNRGNEMAYNYFHDWMTSNQHAGKACGIYDDDCLSGNYKHHNVFANGETAMQSANGPEQRFDHNIIANNDIPGAFGAHGWIPGRWLTAMQSFVSFQVPLVYTLPEYKKYDHINDLYFGSRWAPVANTADGNLYYKNKGKFGMPEIMVGIPTNTINATAEYEKYFNDPKNGDYTIRTDIEVPEELKELQKIQLKDIGIYLSDNRKNTDYKLGEFKAYYPYNYTDNYDSKGAYLAWEKSENADEYILELAADSSFDEVVLTQTCPFNYAYLDDLESGHSIYYWRVTAVSKALKNRETRMCTNDVMVFRTNMNDELSTDLLNIQITKAKAFLSGIVESTEKSGDIAFGKTSELRELISAAESYVGQTTGSQKTIDQMTMLLQNKMSEVAKNSSVYYKDIKNAFKDDDSWIKGEKSQIDLQQEEIRLISTGDAMSSVINTTDLMTYDHLNCFRLKPTVPPNSPESLWQAFAFVSDGAIGKAPWSAPGVLVILKSDVIEFQIRDGINSELMLTADNPFVMNEYNDVECGVISIGGGQRYVLNVNDKNIFDFYTNDYILKDDLYIALYDPAISTVYDNTSGISLKTADTREPVLMLGNKDSFGNADMVKIMGNKELSASGNAVFSAEKAPNCYALNGTLSMDGTDGEKGMFFMNKEPSNENSDTYKLVFKGDKLILKKVKNRIEYTLSIKTLQPNMLKCKFCINVRSVGIKTNNIVVELNDVRIIDYTDDNPITSSGYIGVFSDLGKPFTIAVD